MIVSAACRRRTHRHTSEMDARSRHLKHSIRLTSGGASCACGSAAAYCSVHSGGQWIVGLSCVARICFITSEELSASARDRVIIRRYK